MQQVKVKARVLVAVKPAQESGKDEFTHPIPRRSVWRVVFWPLVVAFACTLLSSAGRAQVTATLTGTVQDASGGVIPGAQVTLTNEATQDSRVEQTNGAGLYAFPSLVPGNYDIKASAKGFKSSAVTGIVLNAGDARTVPALSLTVGATSETVTVSA
ncbi:MAG: carboxypeptidase-like regulatory domain-containing protein, partial [Terracidiphilus sp.]